ncbi:MAG TPA: HAD-IA family hydrolase [Candidatus Acidoferrum sp.]|nr:HAD-IA family hydrolase [Candidatus Acidoferrum sp.]
MPSHKFRAIIFDIGRVLIRVDVSRAMSGLGQGVSASPEEIWLSLQKDPLWADWQEGRVSPRDWHLHVAGRLGGSLTFEQFAEIWNRALDPQPILDIAFLEKLGRSYRLGVLSNTDPIHVVHMDSNFGFLRLFRARTYSCFVGASKPSPLIYREALRVCKVDAEEAVYIDDVVAYAGAAHRLGMTGIVFQSPEQLQTDLRRLGIAVG